MSAVQVTLCLNIPELLGLPDAGLDDADIDAGGSLYMSDGLNGRVYRLQSGCTTADAFDVLHPSPAGDQDLSLNLAVLPDSTFCIIDPMRESIIRYDEAGTCVGEFSVPGVLSICHGPDGILYALSSQHDIEMIGCYDQLGSLVETLPAPARHRARLDPSLVNLEAGPGGDVYVSYGMPPYRIWRVKSDGETIDVWGRQVEYPEDAVLVADIALDAASGILWVLLACRNFGRQMLDAFSPDGEFLGSAEIPHSQSLYGVVCATGDSELYLLDTGSGPGAGNLMRVSVSL